MTETLHNMSEWFNNTAEQNGSFQHSSPRAQPDCFRYVKLLLFQFITSYVSSGGNRIGPVCVSVS